MSQKIVTTTPFGCAASLEAAIVRHGVSVRKRLAGFCVSPIVLETILLLDRRLLGKDFFQPGPNMRLEERTGLSRLDNGAIQFPEFLVR
jgi:hypothetical protein